MAREIVDSGAPVPADPEDGRGAAAVTAEDSAVPVLDLGELDDGRGARAPEDGPAGLASQVRSVFGRLRNDAGYRGLAVRLVLAGLAFAALGALVTETHHRHAVARAAASRLAVDIRVDAAPLVEEPRPGVQYIRGDSSIDVKLHNLGPTPVHLTALRYELGDANPRTCYLVNTDVTVRSDEQMDRAFHVVLPCGPTRETAVPRRPVLLTARIRTNDGRTHSVPVDLSALDQQGGLFDSCAAYRRGFDLNVDS